MFTAGCGLEARYSHLFEAWVDPSDVLIELSLEGIRYRHAKSGVRLAFHFFGVILADSLIAPYQVCCSNTLTFMKTPSNGSPCL